MLCFKYGSRSWLRNLFVSLFIIIRNRKIVWKHGPYCWYYRLNLKYSEWPYRAYIKTAKNCGSCEELVKMFFRLFYPVSVLMIMVLTLLGQFRRLLQINQTSQMFFVCYSLLNSQNISTNNHVNNNEKRLVTMTSLA